MTFRVSRRQIRIEWADCDPLGLLSESRVFEYFDTSSWALFQAALGVEPRDLAGAFDIIGIPLVEVRARFVTPLRFGHRVEIQSSVAEFRRSSFDVSHRLLVGADLAVEGRESRVWVAADKDDPSLLRSRPIPASVIELFKVR